MVALWPVWRWFWLRLDDGSDEPLGLLALGTVAALLWSERRRLRASTVALFIASAFLITYAAAWSILPPLLRAVLAIGALGFAAGFGRTPAGVWGLLCLSLPVMASLQFYCNFPLQKATAQAAAFLINLSPIDVSVSGTLLQWQGNPVSVDPPCSGIKMLWVGGFVHFALATLHRLSWRTLIWLSPVVLLSIIAANALRAALLFPKESGLIALPEWTHAGFGLAVFGAVLAVMVKIYPRLGSAQNATRPSTSMRASSSAFAALFTAATLAMLSPLISGTQKSIPAPVNTEFPGWPAEFEGRQLTQRTLSPHEATFAKNFPGRLGVFDDSDGRQVILRWVTRATRKLHSSTDCLKAAGFDIKLAADRDQWRFFSATHTEANLRGRERIFRQDDAAKRWTDISSWYWSAERNPQTGPWWAVTVIEVSP